MQVSRSVFGLAAVAAVAFVLAAAPTESQSAPVAPAPIAAEATSVRAVVPPLVVMLAGDSLTNDGTGAGWHPEFCRQMTASTGRACDVRNVAVPGSRCDFWPDRIVSLLATHQPDLVIIACGTNDARQGTSAAALGTAWRRTVEAIRTFRSPPIPIVPVLIQYSDPMIDWQGQSGVALVDREAVVNDTLFENLTLYRWAGWFPGVVDWQIIPSGVPYLAGDGVHPTLAGHAAAGRLAFDHIAAGMGWSASADPSLCGMGGHRRGYPRPEFDDC